MKIKDEGKKRMAVEWDDIHEYLTNNGLERSSGTDDVEMTKDAFRKLLFRMDLVDFEEAKEDEELEIADIDENWKYFEEEYFRYGEDTISEKAFASDFDEISEHIENVVTLVLKHLDDYCRKELAKTSLYDELI